MKNKQVTAIFLAAVMTLSSCMPMSYMTAFAAENTAIEGTETTEDAELATENPDESEVQEETNTGSENSGEQTSEDPSDSDDLSEDPAEVSDEDSDISEEEINDEVDSEDASNAIIDGETASEAVTEETPELEEEKKEALTEGIIASGTCGYNAAWTLTGTENAYTLTISGTGYPDKYTVSSQWNDYYQNIETVIIEEGIYRIDERLFEGFSGLQSITIPNSVTSIGSWAFMDCSKLQNVVIPDSVTEIGVCAFSGCSSLQGIKLSGSISYITSNLCKNCSNLQDIVIPASVTMIGNGAFSGCSSLQSITIPNNVISIRDSAFLNCANLESIILPYGLEEIGGHAFSGCSKLQSIDIPDSVTSIGYDAFGNCDSLQSITLPGSVSSIEENIFWSCDSLQTIILSSGVSSIGDRAFYYCEKLQSITIPDSVTSIGVNALSYCISLHDIYYVGTKAEWDAIDGSSFYLNIKNLLLHTSDGVFGAVGAESITLSKTSATLVKGDSLQLKATVTPVDAADGNVTWKTSNSSVLTVSNTGLVKAVAAGTATITASTGDGSLRATCTIKVVNPYTIKFNKAATKATLSTTSRKVIPGSAIGTLPTPKYAGYYFQGWYTAKTGGTKVSASTKPTKSMTLYAHWVKVQSLAKATVTVASCTYNTKAQKPKVTVKLGGKTLKAGNDYTLTYASNKNATKKATVTVKGKNAYNGSVKKTFTINQRDISKSPVSIKLKKTKFGYTGKAIKPGYTAVITVDGKAVNLVKGTDFTVVYKNNTKIGTASVVFTGKGNYKGTKTFKFNILKKATITLNLNKGSNSRVTPKLPSGSQNTIEILAGEKIGKIPDPTRKGYKFVGWYTTPKATGGNLIVSERTRFGVEETRNQTIYARWKKNTYKISFEYGDLVGQDQMFSLPEEMTYDVEKAVNLPILTSEFAKFNGWKEIKGAVAPENCFIVFGETPTVGNKVLYLDCTNYSYSIVFSGSEGGSVNNLPGIYFTWHSKNTLPKASYTPPTGKTFDKWYCTENGQYYQDGAEFDRLTTQDGTVFHFVAVWKEAYSGAAVAQTARDTAASSTEQCAGFVSDCLISNGIEMTKQVGVGPLYDELLRVGFNAYFIQRTGQYIYANGGNNAKIEVGDVIIFKCLGCTAEQKPWKHAGIVTKIDNEGKVYITHRNPGYHIDDVYGGTYSGGCIHGSTDMGFILLKYE